MIMLLNYGQILVLKNFDRYFDNQRILHRLYIYIMNNFYYTIIKGMMSNSNYDISLLSIETFKYFKNQIILI